MYTSPETGLSCPLLMRSSRFRPESSICQADVFPYSRVHLPLPRRQREPLWSPTNTAYVRVIDETAPNMINRCSALYTVSVGVRKSSRVLCVRISISSKRTIFDGVISGLESYPSPSFFPPKRSAFRRTSLNSSRITFVDLFIV